MTFPDERSDANQDIFHLRRLEMLGRIASIAAHDLNNQLMVVLASLETALDAPRIAEAALEQAVASVLRATDLTDRMLAYVRKDQGGGTVFDFAAALRKDEALLRMVVPGRVAFAVDVPDSPLGVRAHPANIQQVLLNLVLNAVDAIGEGEGRVQVSLREEGLSSLALEVRDDGCGMDESTLGRLFEPFRSAKPNGRGLGLVAVRETVQSLGGEIEIHSRSGEGTRIRILLPRVVDVVAVPESHRARKPTPRTGMGRKVLVVEDDPFVRQVVASFLGRGGYTPFTAATATIARDVLGSVGGFWLALLDVSLGGEDGIALMEEIRERLPKTMVLVMSGYDKEHALEGARTPPDGFLMKPFLGAELEAELERLAALFKERTGEDSSPAAPPPASARTPPGSSPTH
jgi:two-component system, cell cycle sensor histidine kinase and response regulator CckA